MVVKLIKPVLAPVLRAQAKRLRRAALEMPEPEGLRSGVMGQPSIGTPPLSILIVGDSCAAGVGAATQHEALASRIASALATELDCCVPWHLIAQTGLTSQGLLGLLRESSLPRADVAIIIIGVNDISNDVPIPIALRRRHEIVRLLIAQSSIRWALFPALPEVEKFPLLPQPLAWYGGFTARQNNALQSRWAMHPRRAHIVSHIAMNGLMHPSLMAADGFHPSPTLYEKTARRLAKHIAIRILRERTQRRHEDSSAA